MTRAEYLAQADERFEPEVGLVGERAGTPGYHTTLADGTWVHSTRGNLDYALACLEDGGAERASRAALVIERVLAHQDTDPYNATYGIWPWFTDEPLTQMAPPDWNWADFCGARLATMLVRHLTLLPADLVTAMRAALGHAGWSIFRRNVQPGYTNIAIMGAAVTLAAGELLDEPRLLAYGRRRLERFLEYTDYHGGLNEYNSPTYTHVALAETERVLELVRDQRARELAEALRLRIWETIAEHFHPATRQWAGPHSRAYSDLLRRGTLEWLTVATGVDLVGEPLDERFALDRELPCPESLRGRFAALDEPESTVVRRFVRRDPDSASTVGTTWLADGACLGTVNHDTLWVQRRPALAYWVTDGEPAVLRVRALRDEKDFATGALWCAQRGGQTLIGLGYVPGQGDHHCSLDRPADGVFTAKRLSFVVDLEAPGAVASQAAGALVLSAGSWQAVVQPLPGTFEGGALQWSTATTERGVRAECRLYDGSPARFGWERLKTARLALALTIMQREGAAPAPPNWDGQDAVWPAADLRLEVPR